MGSLDNVKHKPGGGDVKIFDDKEYLKQIAAVAPESVHTPISEVRFKTILSNWETPREQ